MGLLTPDKPSHESLAWPAAEGSLEGRPTLSPKQLQARQNWPSSPAQHFVIVVWEKLRPRLTSKLFLSMAMCMRVEVCWGSKEVPLLLLHSSILGDPTLTATQHPQGGCMIMGHLCSGCPFRGLVKGNPRLGYTKGGVGLHKAG